MCVKSVGYCCQVSLVLLKNGSSAQHGLHIVVFLRLLRFDVYGNGVRLYIVCFSIELVSRMQVQLFKKCIGLFNQCVC